MPMYSFRCAACGLVFEKMKRMDDRDQAKCPGCGGDAVRSWKDAGVFGVGRSAPKCECEAPCASGCGCGGQCRRA